MHEVRFNGRGGQGAVLASKILDKALAGTKRGMAYIHVSCPTGWRFSPGMLIEVARKAVEANLVPLWEYELDSDTISFTRSVDQPVPVKEYLSLIGKFRHFDGEQVQHIQDATDRHMGLLKRFTDQRLHEDDSPSC